MGFDELYARLNFIEKDIHRKGDFTDKFSSRIINVVDRLDYDSIYFVNDKPIIIFKEFHSFEENKKDIEKLYKDSWNLGEIPILFIKLQNEYILYNTYIFDKEKDNIWKHISLDDEALLNDFSYLNFISNNFWKKYSKEFEGKKRVNDYLLSNLRLVKSKLIKDNLSFETINNIIIRLIFSRYLIDRHILKRSNFYKVYNCTFEELILDKNDLYSFFNFLKDKFNGDIFDISDKEYYEINKNHLKLLYNLFKGDNIESGQTVLFDVYDFSIIPVELISNIYETFLKEEIKKNNGIYYTPLPLVDYIIENTVSQKLKTSEECKILDPSCGSGIFLVESLRKII